MKGICVEPRRSRTLRIYKTAVRWKILLHHISHVDNYVHLILFIDALRNVEISGMLL